LVANTNIEVIADSILAKALDNQTIAKILEALSSTEFVPTIRNLDRLEELNKIFYEMIETRKDVIE
jgi:hypothetical protein